MTRVVEGGDGAAGATARKWMLASCSSRTSPSGRQVHSFFHRWRPTRLVAVVAAEADQRPVLGHVQARRVLSVAEKNK